MQWQLCRGKYPKCNNTFERSDRFFFFFFQSANGQGNYERALRVHQQVAGVLFSITFKDVKQEVNSNKPRPYAYINVLDFLLFIFFF